MVPKLNPWSARERHLLRFLWCKDGSREEFIEITRGLVGVPHLPHLTQKEDVSEEMTYHLSLESKNPIDKRNVPTWERGERKTLQADRPPEGGETTYSTNICTHLLYAKHCYSAKDIVDNQAKFWPHSIIEKPMDVCGLAGSTLVMHKVKKCRHREIRTGKKHSSDTWLWRKQRQPGWRILLPLILLTMRSHYRFFKLGNCTSTKYLERLTGWWDPGLGNWGCGLEAGQNNSAGWHPIGKDAVSRPFLCKASLG